MVHSKNKQNKQKKTFFKNSLDLTEMLNTYKIS